MPPLKSVLEAALLAAAEPVSIERLAALFDEEQRPSLDTVRTALLELARDYEGRGLELVEVASGFRVQVPQSFAPWVSRLWEERAARYSRALLETLALIAYRQPITRGEIEEVRGVSVSTTTIKTLLERNWIKVLGHREVPGRPALYGTTREFLDYFNLKSLAELPPLAAIRDLDLIGAELESRRAAAEPPAGAASEQNS
jgi:segregation and condensation protein B